MVLAAVHCGAIREGRSAVVVVLVVASVMNVRRARSSCGDGEECILDTVLSLWFLPT